MKYLILFEDFSLPLRKPVEPEKTSRTTKRNPTHDELTDEEREATDMLLKQYYVNHEEETVKISHKNAKYRAL